MPAGALAVAAGLVAFRRCWRWARIGITAVHESGHAVAALVVGRKVTAIHLRPDTSGVTVHYGPAGRYRRLPALGRRVGMVAARGKSERSS